MSLCRSGSSSPKFLPPFLARKRSRRRARYFFFWFCVYIFFFCFWVSSCSMIDSGIGLSSFGIPVRGTKKMSTQIATEMKSCKLVMLGFIKGLNLKASMAGSVKKAS